KKKIGLRNGTYARRKCVVCATEYFVFCATNDIFVVQNSSSSYTGFCHCRGRLQKKKKKTLLYLPLDLLQLLLMLGVDYGH
ncbi:unnamed protein product, partial [Prunus brigantina]